MGKMYENYKSPTVSDGTWGIEVENLTVRFGNFVAVKNLSFKVRKGEILGIVGSNGAGKTTTVKAILGLVKHEGEVKVLSKPLNEVKSRIGYVPQTFSLYRSLTVEENLMFFGRIYSVDERNLEIGMSKLLRFVELEKWRKTTVAELSADMKQRLMVACSMLHDPDILILDEPTAGIDPISRKNFWEGFKALRDEGKAILITTHHMEDAENCDRIIIMKNGEKVIEGSLEDIRKVVGERVLIKPFNIDKAVKLFDEFGFHYSVENDWIEVYVDDSSSAMPEIISALKRRGIEIEKAKTKIEGLESAIIDLSR
jgi:ABC-2 type transport system ATP-binding protein